MKFYANSKWQIEKIFNQAGKELGKEISYIKIEYFGIPQNRIYCKDYMNYVRLRI